MLFRVDTISRPTTLPVTLSTLKQFVRLYDDSDDVLLNNFLIQCTELAENFLNRKLFSYQYKWTIAKPHNLYNQTDSYFNDFNYGWSPFLYSYNRIIELPYTPVQAVQAVSYGYWDQPVDTFLTEGTDYYLDLATDPARIRLITTPDALCRDHLSIVFTTGYDQTSTIATKGTATASGTVSLTAGGVTVTVTVTTGDTAATFTSNAYTALAAVAAAPSASVFTPSLIGLRGPNCLVTVNNQVAGLTVTPSAPIGSIPISISNAIVARAANLYRAMGRPEFQIDDTRFYADLAPWRFFSFGKG